MADFGRGAKAGIIAGIINGIITVILGLILAIEYWEEILDATGYDISTIEAAKLMEAIGDLAPTLIIAGIIGGIISGLILGLIYAGIYNSLPGSTSVKKALVLTIIGWIIFSLALNYNNLNIDWTFYLIGSGVFGLIAWAIWGYLLGIFWDKFEREQPVA